ncbi:MAG: phosphotransferase family protein [Egibacteraceae bacterium]
MSVHPGIHAQNVTRWLSDHVERLEPPLDFAPIAGGRSNLTYKVTDRAGGSWVLRRPPLHGVLPSAHDMGREYRIIAALGPTPVPVPTVVGLCEDEQVNGAPFFVMDFLDGLVLRDAAASRRHLDERGRRAAGEHLVDALVALHEVDPDEVGLGQLGRREDYVARQLRRWRGQWQAVATRELPLIDEVHRRLSARVPAQQGTAVVHGDYRLDNVILRDDGRVAGVVDWELCTLGDPLADLGTLQVYWAQASERPSPLPAAPTAAAGFMSRDEIAERYAARSGRDLSELDFYRALAYWKLAVILEGVSSRFQSGAYGESGEDVPSLAERVPLLAEAAAAATARAGR